MAPAAGGVLWPATAAGARPRLNPANCCDSSGSEKLGACGGTLGEGSRRSAAARAARGACGKTRFGEGGTPLEVRGPAGCVPAELRMPAVPKLNAGSDALLLAFCQGCFAGAAFWSAVVPVENPRNTNDASGCGCRGAGASCEPMPAPLLGCTPDTHAGRTRLPVCGEAAFGGRTGCASCRLCA